ncbi:hypothetical protein FRC17_009786 [Serendipita sp. 399]|nr:hypothetical protein FRC17_009786 [Serendipita sp. 399]
MSRVGGEATGMAQIKKCSQFVAILHQDDERVKAFKESIKQQIAEKSRLSGASNPVATASISAQSQVEGIGKNSPHRPEFISLTDWLTPIAHARPSKPIHDEGVFDMPLLSLASLVRPATQLCWDPYNYQYFTQAIQEVANVASLPDHLSQLIRKIVLLGQWKQQELDNGSLSYRALALRAFQVEKELLLEMNAFKSTVKFSATPLSTPATAEGFEEGEDMFRFMDFGDGDEENGFAESPFESCRSDDYSALAERGVVAKAGGQGNKEHEDEDLSGTTKRDAEATTRDSPEALPYLSALLFLHCIVSGINHRVPEIITTSTRMSRLLSTTGSTTDRTIPTGQRLLATVLLECISREEGDREPRPAVLMPAGDQGVANGIFDLGIIKHESGVEFYYSDADAEAD